MLGIDPKAARVAWTVFLVALLLATAYAVRETLAVFVIALLFAYLLCRWSASWSASRPVKCRRASRWRSSTWRWWAQLLRWC